MIIDPKKEDNNCHIAIVLIAHISLENYCYIFAITSGNIHFPINVNKKVKALKNVYKNLR
jgi:hypothetical protein